MEQDTDGTVAAWQTARQEVIKPVIADHSGKIVKLTGDGFLVEFLTVQDAVNCAITMQRGLASSSLDFRMGVNLGDILDDGEDIHGEGVNIAARLEGLADPGGICISGDVYNQVRNRIEATFEDMGDQKVKNVAELVRAYRINLDPAMAGKVVGEKKTNWTGLRTASVAMAIVFIIGVGVITVWKGYLRPTTTESESASQKTGERKLPAKPSIAVLPFKNISGESAQDYFSDGITEDIITDLSKFDGLFVIASNTVFTYKGKPVNVQDVSRDLGVRYVLEGSVQKAGGRVRVNAQLIDGTTGHHVWAERLVRDMKDLFALQDEIVRTIVATLAIKVDNAERERVMRKPTDSLEAYDFVLRGREHCARTSRSANAEARKLIRQAIELDPRYGPAYEALGWCYMDAVRYGWTATPSQTLEQVHDLAQKALSLDEQSASAHRLLGTTYYRWQKIDLASDEFDRALELNPNDADTFDALGAVRLYEGRPDAAIKAVETALRFNPNLGPSGLVHLGLAYYLKGQYGGAIKTLERALGQYPDLAILHVGLAAAYTRANRAEDAARAATNVRRFHPFFKVDEFGNAFRKPADRNNIREGLRDAGLK
jgi:adenylate cyclase